MIGLIIFMKVNLLDFPIDGYRWRTENRSKINELLIMVRDEIITSYY